MMNLKPLIFSMTRWFRISLRSETCLKLILVYANYFGYTKSSGVRIKLHILYTIVFKYQFLYSQLFILFLYLLAPCKFNKSPANIKFKPYDYTVVWLADVRRQTNILQSATLYQIENLISRKVKFWRVYLYFTVSSSGK